MIEQKSAKHAEMHREAGTLVFKDHCYALRRSDGTEYWLELNNSPCHLIDEHVTIEGEFFPPNIVSVQAIRPA